MTRLDKYLCGAGLGTRSEVKALIKKGQVTVNGVRAARPEQKIDENLDKVSVNGQTARYSEFAYIMLNKPAGVVSATEDKRERTVLDLLPPKDRKGLFPVGRLDKDTEGLLLLTDDGELAHRLLSPKKHVDKTYYAKIEGTVTEEHVARFLEGLDIGDEKPAMPAKLQILSAGKSSEVQVTVQEGRFHQVKRMFGAVGCRVVCLKRLSIGPLKLDEDLSAGEYRPLTEQEICALKDD